MIVHNLLGGPAGYGQLKARLPGVGTNVLSDRLKKLEHAGVVERIPGAVGQGVGYALTDRGRALEPLLAEMRRWGADELLCPDAGPEEFDLSYEIPAELNLDQTYLWIIDGAPITLTIRGQTLAMRSGGTAEPDLTLTTSLDFMRRWAAGETNWDSGISTGEVVIDGDEHTWETMLVATNYPGRPPDLTKRLLEGGSS